MKVYVVMREGHICDGVYRTYEEAKNYLYYDEMEQEYEERREEILEDGYESPFKCFMEEYGHKILEFNI